MEYLSQKQIAERLGVSKQRIYRCIKTHCISEAHSEVVKGNTVLMYDEQAIQQIKRVLDGGASNEVHHEALNEAVCEAPHEAVNEALYEALLKQLDILNEQLKEKDKQIDKLEQALDQSQELVGQAQTLLDQAQKLHVMDKQKMLMLEDKVREEQKRKKWMFWK